MAYLPSVLIGALAARLQAFPRVTADADIAPSGRLDLAFEPSGTDGYEDLVRNAIAYEVFGVELKAAALEDIIRSKQASDRPQDRQDVLVMREMLRRCTEK